MIYDFKKIEKYWQKYWEINQTFKSPLDKKKLKFYILDMFPYPSGEGLHVGHLLGYIASDIYARYKRCEGYNVLHPIGFDSFGLPSEQYAIQTGKHPIETTKTNIKRYKKQLKNIGISFDWSREINTSDPNYYKWTQWIFIQTFNSWYDKKNNKARPIIELLKIFENEGNCSFDEKLEHTFTNKEWNEYSLYKKEEILKNYRLAFRSKSKVNWCPYLGTVLANDEIKNGKSERGGYPVFQKEIIQWNIRITAYADRLLTGLDNVDWPKSIKESQKNWIGKSFGLDIYFRIYDDNKKFIHVFTTRPETIFGVTFIVISPDNNKIISYITKKEYKYNVQFYVEKTQKEREYKKDKVSGEFTGTYVLHPFIAKKIPVYISDYVLSSYGTGIVMGVPAHDKKDHNFAKKFDLDIISVLYNKYNINEKPYEERIGKCINSDFLNGLDVKNDLDKIKQIIEKTGIGRRTIKYKIRDAIFSRQRYWGEPIPIYYKEGVPKNIPEDKLPLLLPTIDKYNNCRNYNEAPLSFANFWAWDEKNQKVVSNNLIDEKRVFPIEINTMPGWAGSSWYFLRYMDPNNNKEFLSVNAENYWKNVDIYIGGAEHSIGHLIYARFWHKLFMDIGCINSEEPFKKLINQGMILGCSAIVSRIPETGQIVSIGNNNKQKNIQELYIDIGLLKSEKEVDIDKIKNWRNEFSSSEFILEDNKLFCKRKIEKMSKSKFNVINPDDICIKYGADTMRMYEMFIGPISQSKIWNENGIIGVHNFIKKFWRLFHINERFYVSQETPSLYELKILHKTIKRIKDNIETFSFNTSVSFFMIAVNELTKLKCQKLKILTPLLILISPFAPHISEEIWKKLGNKKSICYEKIPKYIPEYVVDNLIEYPVMLNGKLKFKLLFDIEKSVNDIQQNILEDKKISKYLDNINLIKKIIVIPQKMINIVTKK